MAGGGGRLEKLAAILAAERERWPLWLPAAFGLGVAGFFALTADPPPFVAWAVAVLAGVCGWLARSRPAGLACAAGLCALALGFAAAERRTMEMDAPMLTRPQGPLALSGRVAAVEGAGAGLRVTVADLRAEQPGTTANNLPRKVRLRLAADQERPPVGAAVAFRARLLPSSPPAAPGAYDFQRHAFFQGLGATGFVVGAMTVTAPPPDRFAGGLALEMERWREIIAQRVATHVGDPASAGIVGALLHGEQSFVPADAMQAMRDSGLAHLLSISGLHIGLVAGIVMYAVRALLALFPYVALHWPCKKIAAVCGLLAAAAYTALVGPSAPALRSTLMTGLALAAVMADRNPFSMRLVAFAAVVVMAFMPESLAGPSFQMSFAAVAALIAAYETAAGPIARWREGAGPVLAPLFFLGGLAFTSVVASLATAPFSLYHFQSVAVYGVFSNLAAVPITSFWIMPLLLLVYVLMPFGWEGWPLAAAGWGVEAILWIAEWTAGLPGAVLNAPAMPPAGLALTVAGGLWLLAWRTPWRLLGVPLLLAGLLSPMVAERPDALVSDDGALMAVRLNDGRLVLSTARASKFEAETWLRRDGWSRDEIKAGAPVWPQRGASPDGVLRCDAEGCLYRRAGRTVAFLRRPGAQAEDCAVADAVAAAFDVGRRCAAGLVADSDALRKRGAHALYLRDDGVFARTVGEERGNRPWTR